MKNKTLFIHGFMGTKSDWDQVLKNYVGESILIDLPGHGDNTDLDYRDIHDYAKKLLKTLPSEKIDLCGYSMGGRVALCLLLLDPSRVKKVTIISAAPYCDNPRERVLKDRKLLNGNFDQFIDHWYHSPLFGDITKAPNYPKLRQQRLNQEKVILQKSLEIFTIANQKDLREDLYALNKPLTYITGEHDKKYRNIALEMREHYPNLELINAPKCGHNVLFENPELISRYL